MKNTLKTVNICIPWKVIQVIQVFCVFIRNCSFIGSQSSKKWMNAMVNSSSLGIFNLFELYKMTKTYRF